jgi:hypothetical protein
MAATAPTAELHSATPGRQAASARRARLRRAPTLLLGPVLIALAYGVFFHGAAQIPDENRLQVALAVVALVACGAWLLGGGLRLDASRWAWVGFGLMVAFVAWTAISLAWSVAPDGTWTEFNRATAYAVMLVLALSRVVRPGGCVLAGVCCISADYQRFCSTPLLRTRAAAGTAPPAR